MRDDYLIIYLWEKVTLIHKWFFRNSVLEEYEKSAIFCSEPYSYHVNMQP